jgi:acetyl esterase/lipase
MEQTPIESDGSMVATGDVPAGDEASQADVGDQPTGDVELDDSASTDLDDATPAPTDAGASDVSEPSVDAEGQEEDPVATPDAGAEDEIGSGGAPFPDSVDPPMRDGSSNLPIAGPGGGYQVDGNIPYGDLPQQRLDVMYPNGGGPNATSKSPGVIMFHGGGWIQGDKATMSSFYSRFLAHGFIVCSAEYRVADGAPDHIAPAAVEDALLAAKWFWDYLDYYNVDRERYVVTGASAGGHLALMVGMATPEAGLGPTSPQDFEIAAIVNGYGPSDVPDLLQRNTSWAVQWLPANTPDRDALAARLSPQTYARADIPPLISVHGSNDTTVPVAQSEALDGLLQVAGADAEIHIVSGAGHGFSSPAGAWPDAEQAMFGFLEAHGIAD